MTRRLFVPTGAATAELEVKNSRFIGFAGRAGSPGEAREKTAALRAAHPGARHVVHAFICGPAGEVQGQSDDGEPHGTAGRPVLEVLKGRDLTDTIVGVVRYFGGTKLGTGGLVRAYSEIARMTLDLLPAEPFVKRIVCACRASYPQYERVRGILAEEECSVDREDFGETVEMVCSIPEDKLAAVNGKLSDCSSGTVALVPVQAL